MSNDKDKSDKQGNDEQPSKKGSERPLKAPKHVPTAEEMDERMEGLAGCFAIDIRRKNVPLKDITLSDSRLTGNYGIMDLIRDQLSGALAEKHSHKKDPKWHQFVTEEMIEESIYGWSNKSGIFMTMDKGRALYSIGQFHFDPFVLPANYSNPLDKKEIEGARTHFRTKRSGLAAQGLGGLRAFLEEASAA